MYARVAVIPEGQRGNELNGHDDVDWMISLLGYATGIVTLVLLLKTITVYLRRMWMLLI